MDPRALVPLAPPPAGALVHLVAGQLAGWDGPDGCASRDLTRWGGLPEELVLGTLRALGWPLRLSPAGSAAAGLGLRWQERDPHWVAQLPRPALALAGLAGGLAGWTGQGWRYDLNSAYPAAALTTPYPDWARARYCVTARETARALADERLHGVAEVRLAGVPGGLILTEPWPATVEDGGEFCGILDTITIRAAVAAGARLAGAGRAVLAPARGRWEWYTRAFGRLWELRQRDPERGRLYKLAANGLVGRMAARGDYIIARAEPARADGEYIRAPDGRMLSIRPVRLTRLDPRAWVWAALVIASVRARLWETVRQHQAVWWWVDAMVTPAPLPDRLLGPEPGQWRLEGSGRTRILSVRGGLLAGRPLLASVSVRRRDELLAAADAAV